MALIIIGSILTLIGVIFSFSIDSQITSNTKVIRGLKIGGFSVAALGIALQLIQAIDNFNDAKVSKKTN